MPPPLGVQGEKYMAIPEMENTMPNKEQPNQAIGWGGLASKGERLPASAE